MLSQGCFDAACCKGGEWILYEVRAEVVRVMAGCWREEEVMGGAGGSSCAGRK
jgi:hypothetical protein